MPSLIYNSCIIDAFRGQINFESDGFKVMLLSEDYLPDKSHARRSDIDQYEISGDGYAAGGMRASVAILGIDGDAIEVSLGGARWVNASLTARYAGYYHNAGSPQEDELVALIEFSGLVISSNGGTFVLSESTLRIQN